MIYQVPTQSRTDRSRDSHPSGSQLQRCCLKSVQGRDLPALIQISVLSPAHSSTAEFLFLPRSSSPIMSQSACWRRAQLRVQSLTEEQSCTNSTPHVSEANLPTMDRHHHGSSHRSPS